MSFQSIKRNPYLKSTLWGILFVFVFGTLSHFLYTWFGQHPILGLFVSVNESTWEHMKLFFFPMLLFCIIEFIILDRRDTKRASCSLGILVGTWMIPILYYSYSGILGFHLMLLDVLTFYVSVIVAFWIRYITRNQRVVSKYSLLLKLLVVVQMFLFLWFTYSPPELGIFMEG